MRPKHSHTGYGVWDITRQVARRVQQEWESVESPPRRTAVFGGKENQTMFAPPMPPPKPEKEARPLAA